MPRPNHKNCVEWIERVQESEGPEEPFLLGFGTEIRRSIRSYMRDLWLPFRSILSMMPKEWYCRRVEAFVAEISQRVNEFVNEDGKLGSELGRMHYTLNGEDLQECEPFAFVADELLVTREWGDNLWGHRRYCTGPLIEPDRETETPKPRWPQDQEHITLAVRRWIAAQIQWKIESPSKKGNKVVPPVENAPDNAEARRVEIHTGSRTEREDSEDEGRLYVSWTQPRDLESPPSPPTKCRVPLQTIPRTTRARAAQQVEGSQTVSAARSKKRKRQGPSTRRSKAPKVSTSRSRHENVSEKHTPTHVPDTAIDSGVALSLEGPPTEVVETILSETTNSDRVGYRSRVDLIADNPPSIASLQSEAFSSQQGEKAVLCDPSPTLNLILDDLEVEDEAIFVKEAPVLPRLDDSAVAVDAQDHVITLRDTPRASPNPSTSTTLKPTEDSNSSRRRALVACEDDATPTAEPDATQAFLEEVARDTHAQSSSRTGTKNQIAQSDAMMPAPLPLIASPISPIAAPRLSIPAPVPLSRFTIPSMLASPVLNLPQDPRGFANPESQRPASHSSESQPPLSNPKFPPGSSKVPRRCSQCDHSLDELVDVMTDSGGFAQWKKKCTYCRREVGRSKPCICYRCQSRTEENINELPTQAASSTGHVRVPTQTTSSTGLTLTPLVRQLRIVDTDEQFLYGWPPTSFLDELARDTNYRSMAFNGPAPIAEAGQQLATTDRDVTPTTFDLPDFNPSDLGYKSGSDAQQENAVAGQATYAKYQPTAPAYPAPAPYDTHSVDIFSNSTRLSVPSLHVNSSYLPTPTLSSWSISAVSTGNSKWSSPVIPRNLTILDDTDWVIDERPELTRAMRQIQQNWGSGWRAKLQAGGVYTDSRPNEQLAKSLARLSSFERNIVALLNSLQAFRNDSPHNSRGAGTQPDPYPGLFGAYDGWLKSMSAMQFDDWRSFLSTSKKYMCHPV